MLYEKFEMYLAIYNFLNNGLIYNLFGLLESSQSPLFILNYYDKNHIDFNAKSMCICDSKNIKQNVTSGFYCMLWVSQLSTSP